jgi:hypothetical protein
MDGPRRSGRKRTQTQFEAATETVARDAGKTQAVQGRARRARAAAIAAAYEPLVGLVQLGAVRFKVVVSDAANAAAPHHRDMREARSCFDEGGVRMLFSVTDTAARPMVYSRQQPSGELAELFRSHADLVIMDKEAAGSGACSTTFHGRLGAGVTISVDAVPSVFNSGLLSQHPICRSLFNLGRGVQGNSHATTTAAATEAHSVKAVQQVYERFETACDDLDSGFFDLDLDRHCYCCMQFFDGAGASKGVLKDGHRWCQACSYQVHGLGKHGGQHTDFATTERPNDRCPAGCSGCSY